VASPDPAPQSQPARDQQTAIHIYTLLSNAGLSDADILDVGDELWKRIKLRVAKLAASQDRDQRLRYCHDKSYREQVNMQIVGEEFLAMKFTRDEIARIDEGLRLKLLGPTERTGRRFAKVTGVNGEPREYEVITKDLGGGVEKTLLKDVLTSQITEVNW